MTEPLSKDIIRKIREHALCGIPKKLIVEESGIGLSTVFKFAKSIHALKKRWTILRGTHIGDP